MFVAIPLWLTKPLSQSPLGLWIAEHMPDLGAELGPMTHEQAREKLNSVTGLNIQSSDPIRATMPLYLEALKAKTAQ